MPNILVAVAPWQIGTRFVWAETLAYILAQINSEEQSTLTVLKVDNSPELGMIVHIGVERVKLLLHMAQKMSNRWF